MSFQPGVDTQEAAVRFRNPFDRAASRQPFAYCGQSDILRRSITPPSRREASLPPGIPLIVFLLLSLFLANNSWAYTFLSTGLYHSYNDLAPWADDLQTQNPNLVKVVQYGTSHLGNPLLAINITVDPSVNNPAKPEFLFTAGIHAREVISSEAARSIAEKLINGYRGGDPLYVNMLATRDVWIVPDLNPDGRLAFEAGASAQRKNMNGVDLNRNFTHRWGQYPNDQSTSSDTYCGPNVLSEKESSSLWSLLHEIGKFSNLLCAVDFHSGAPTILPPWSSPIDNRDNAGQIPPAVREKFSTLVNTIIQNNTTRRSLNPLTPKIDSTRLDYESYGALSDSIYEEFSTPLRTTYAMTEELYKGSYIGSYPDSYFSYFNPVTAATRDAAIQNAVDSALYVLSDSAFVVPEPSTFVLLAAGGFVLLARVRRRRRA
jgi:hypothetical protein